MNWPKQTPVIIFIAIIVLGIGYVAQEVWLSSDEAAVLSCLSSINAATGSSTVAREILSGNSTRELTSNEISQILSERALDCSTVELNPNELHVAVGNINAKSKNPVRVWQNGRDGISGTGDDLIIPYEEMDRP